MRASSSPIYSTHCRALQLTPYRVLSYLLAPSPTIMTTPYTPIPIDIKQWRKIDRDVVVEKFIVTAVWMPHQYEVPSNSESRQLIHWCASCLFCGFALINRSWSCTGAVEVLIARPMEASGRRRMTRAIGSREALRSKFSKCAD